MTLQAIEPSRLTVPDRQDWPEPEPPVRCELPACPRRGSQWHHVVRRSVTGGPVDWIAIDGLVVWNKVRVCLWCHDKINSHRYWLTYEDGAWLVWVRETKHARSMGEWLQHPKSGDWFALIGSIDGWRSSGPCD